MMRNTKMFMVLMLAFSCLSVTVFAEGNTGSYEIILVGADTGTKETDLTDGIFAGNEYVMNTDTDYEMDLEGDGETEQISYKTYENDDGQGNCNAVLEIYKNGELLWSCTDPDWSYYWELSRFSLSDGSQFLYAVSRSDNDWNSQALILSKPEENDTFSVLADITKLTRQSEEKPGNPLSSWARTCYAATLSTGENTVTVPWSETLYCTGNMTVYVDYEITDDSVKQKDAPFRLDDQRTWTAWQEFDVYMGPGLETEVFHVNPGDTVNLTEITFSDGKTWLKCQNKEKEEGWFPDAEEYIHQPSEENPEEYYQGYFKECIFAG